MNQFSLMAEEKGGHGLCNKVCVALYHWPEQDCWKIFHLHTQGLHGGRCGSYMVKQGVKSVSCQDNKFLLGLMVVQLAS